MRGAYSLVFLSEDTLVAVRDPMGFRPLALGKARAKDREVWVVSSETCAFELIGAEYVRDLEPGEMVIINESGVQSVRPFGAQPAHRCVFEWIYFARPDSTIDGRSVYRARERMGRRLAIEHAVAADVVIPVPDSGMAAAIGYSRESGIPYDQGLMRSHFMGRTFIEPSQQIRHFGVKLKLSPVREVLKGNRVVVVDDSIVRGTTSRKIVGMIRSAGAREVHLRISSPPTVGPCRYGIDTPTSEELIGANHTVDQIRDFVGRRLARLPVAGGAVPVGRGLALRRAGHRRRAQGPAGVAVGAVRRPGLLRRLLLRPLPDRRRAAGAPAPAPAHQRLVRRFTAAGAPRRTTTWSRSRRWRASVRARPAIRGRRRRWCRAATAAPAAQSP